MAIASPNRRKLVAAAMGRIPCDFILKNAVFLDVFSCQWLRSDISICDGHIVGLEPGLKAKREIDLKGKAVVPGFIDAHVHVESSMLSPWEFERAVLPRGTTTAICDPHELANVQGVSGIEFFLNAATQLRLDLRVMLSSCVPATDFETNGAGHLPASVLTPLRTHPKVLGLAEMMNFPGVLSENEEVWDKLEAFSDSVIDGHCPLLRGKQLSAYIAAGISSCHESTQKDEAAEKLSKGMSVWIREGSVTKDLHALASLITPASSPQIGFCTDDRNPLDIATEGHLDHLVRGAIALGVAPEIAYRCVSWSVARHYGLSSLGAIAPGYLANLVVLDDIHTCQVGSVFVAGNPLAETAWNSPATLSFPNSVRATRPEATDLQGPKGKVLVIGVRPGTILTEKRVLSSDAPGVAHLTVLERYGKGSSPANAYVQGFGEKFRGAIASSVGHDSHNLIVVGSHTEDMAVALDALIQSGGGFAVVDRGEVKGLLPLPLGGLMSRESAGEVRKSVASLRQICREQGCELPEPFLQLAFLSLPVIPSLKLTDKGLFDVDAFSLVSVEAR